MAMRLAHSRSDDWKTILKNVSGRHPDIPVEKVRAAAMAMPFSTAKVATATLLDCRCVDIIIAAQGVEPSLVVLTLHRALQSSSCSRASVRGLGCPAAAEERCIVRIGGVVSTDDLVDGRS